jgi:hypothetical protein
MKKWLHGFLTRIDVELLFHRISETLREIAVLWFVFALLDKLLVEKLTATWTALHSSAAFAVWCFGTYLEVVRKERKTS